MAPLRIEASAAVILTALVLGLFSCASQREEERSGEGGEKTAEKESPAASGKRERINRDRAERLGWKLLFHAQEAASGKRTAEAKEALDRTLALCEKYSLSLELKTAAKTLRKMTGISGSEHDLDGLSEEIRKHDEELQKIIEKADRLERSLDDRKDYVDQMERRWRELLKEYAGLEGAEKGNESGGER
jgi:hypothetical protein